MLKKIKHIGLVVLNKLFGVLKQIKLPGLEGLSLYDLLEMYVIGIVRGALTTRAGSISYSFFMSLFPFLLFVLNLLAIVSFIDYQNDIMPFLESVFPENTLAVFQDTVANIFEKKRVGLLSTSFVFSMFLMANGVNALFSGFQESYHTTINQSFVKQYITSLWVALLLALFLFLAVITIPVVEVFVTKQIASQRLIDNDFFGITLVKYGLFTVLYYSVVALFYYFGAPEKNAKRYFTPGASLSTLLFILATYLFGVYVENFAHYNELYGSIGAILILMLYIWLNATIVLLGYELNAALLTLKRNKNQAIV